MGLFTNILGKADDLDVNERLGLEPGEDVVVVSPCILWRNPAVTPTEEAKRIGVVNLVDSNLLQTVIPNGTVAVTTTNRLVVGLNGGPAIDGWSFPGDGSYRLTDTGVKAPDKIKGFDRHREVARHIVLENGAGELFHLIVGVSSIADLMCWPEPANGARPA